ncbi:MAG: fused MFS/spermidine synthase [Gammaproteobacteria bacterium]|nr:fused MFS/spermidine synthase [Gammaproteobacteria bacterium]
MFGFGEKRLHSTRDEHGLIEVIENRNERSLHFGSPAKQSSYLLNDPNYLHLSYTRAMLTSLIFQPKPRKILIVGLGGGSLVKFLLNHLPDCEIDVVELRGEVYQTARQYFHLPDDLRLTVHINDIRHHIQQLRSSHSNHYDLILVDAFVNDGLSDSVVGNQFFSAVFNFLKPKGILSMNLWHDDQNTSKWVMETINATFGNRAMKISLDDKENVITLVRKGLQLHPFERNLLQFAKDLQGVTQIELPKFLRVMREHSLD